MRGPLRAFFRAIFITPWLIIPASSPSPGCCCSTIEAGSTARCGPLGIVECCPPPEWFGDFTLAMPALIATNGWGGYPLTMIMWLAGLQSIPKDHYEAASVDGAGRWRRFRHITLPAMGPTILTILLLDTIYTFRNWDLPYLTTGGGPGDTTIGAAAAHLPRGLHRLQLRHFGRGRRDDPADHGVLRVLVFAASRSLAGRLTFERGLRHIAHIRGPESGGVAKARRAPRPPARRYSARAPRRHAPPAAP